MNTIPETLTPESLKAWREERNLSFADLASLSQHHHITWRRWESGATAIPKYLPIVLSHISATLNQLFPNNEGKKPCLKQPISKRPRRAH